MSVEKPILDNLRRWAIDYFVENSVIHKSNYTPLKDVANIPIDEGKEIDLLVKIMKVMEKDEQTLELRIKDIS